MQRHYIVFDVHSALILSRYYFFHAHLTDAIQESKGTWRERLHAWKGILRNDKLVEELDASNAKYVVEFNMKEVENSLRKDVVDKVTDTQGARALWISKRWWRYRPKLPYTYFLEKLDCSEVSTFILCYLQFCGSIHVESSKISISYELL